MLAIPLVNDARLVEATFLLRTHGMILWDESTRCVRGDKDAENQGTRFSPIKEFIWWFVISFFERVGLSDRCRCLHDRCLIGSLQRLEAPHRNGSAHSFTLWIQVRLIVMEYLLITHAAPFFSWTKDSLESGFPLGDGLPIDLMPCNPLATWTLCLLLQAACHFSKVSKAPSPSTCKILR